MGACAENPSGEMKVARAIAGMEGGAGEFSYTRNSRVQSQCINFLKPILEQEIQELNNSIRKPGSPFRVADFGCSVGANTLQYAEICYRSVQASNNQSSPAVPVQYYFCDLPSNDFNTLFRQFEDWRNRELPTGEEFYAAAVPGSFYGRLFPRASLDVAISIMSVQWMSQIELCYAMEGVHGISESHIDELVACTRYTTWQAHGVPDAVVERGSPAYNKGRVWIDGNKNVAAVEAFAQTARQDLVKYLQCRAEEVAPGGLVAFYMPGRVDERHPEIQRAQEAQYSGPCSKVFEDTWEELVLEGIIEEERRDSFNVPVYYHSVGDVRAAAESTNAFHIKQVKIQHQSYFEPSEVERILANPEAYGRFARSLTQSVLNSFVVEHIGHDNSRLFFERLERNAAAAAREKRIPSLPLDCLSAVLIRK